MSFKVLFWDIAKVIVDIISLAKRHIKLQPRISLVSLDMINLANPRSAFSMIDLPLEEVNLFSTL